MKAIYQPRGRALEYAPLAVNLATGCIHGCKYCYAPPCLKKDREDYHSRPNIRRDIISMITADLREMDAKGDKGPVLLCFVTDPYQSDDIAPVTRAALEAFNASKVAFNVLTKGGLRAEKDFDLYRPGDAFATTLTFMDMAKSLEIEPKAAPPTERIEAIKRAHARGIKTWVSFEPALDENEMCLLFMAVKDHTDLFKFGKVSGFASTITDWRGYAQGAIKACKHFGKDYYIKEDLRKCLV